MSVDEFIEQYGPIELMKFLKVQNPDEYEALNKEMGGIIHRSPKARSPGGRSPGKGSPGMDQMKDLMMNNLNVKTYGDDESNRASNRSPGGR